MSEAAGPVLVALKAEHAGVAANGRSFETTPPLVAYTDSERAIRRLMS
jgi:hypothetical protein